jgi:hypothetical protein
MLGLHFFTRDSGGGTVLVSRHPRHSATWYWSLSWQPYRADEKRWLFKAYLDRIGGYQKHHWLGLFGIGKLMLSTQSYHQHQPRTSHQ